eukprot:5146949-Amphidinium_carterae.1
MQARLGQGKPPLDCSTSKIPKLVCSKQSVLTTTHGAELFHSSSHAPKSFRFLLMAGEAKESAEEDLQVQCAYEIPANREAAASHRWIAIIRHP